MTQQHMATWPESPKRVRKKILTHAKDTPRSHTKRLSSPSTSRDLQSSLHEGVKFLIRAEVNHAPGS